MLRLGGSKAMILCPIVKDGGLRHDGRVADDTA
jgi:hypothetical protein